MTDKIIDARPGGGYHTDPMSEDADKRQVKIKPEQAALVLLARLVIFLERLWPALLPLLGVISVFALVTLFDLWQFIPGPVHYLLLGLFACILIFLMVRDLADLEWPGRLQALARLEADSQLPHAPLQALEDVPFTPEDRDHPLWMAHQQRMGRLVTQVSLDKGHAAGTEERDPYALRYGVILLFAFAFFVAWGDMRPRFWQAFSPQIGSGAPVSVDLWIDPPAYTGKAPITLLQSAVSLEGRSDQIAVPVGSVLNTRIAGAGNNRIGRARIEIKTSGGKTRANLQKTGSTLTGETVLDENSALILSVQGKRASWPVIVTADKQPVVIFREVPSTTDSNRVRMVVEIEDDYGITSANAILRLDPDQARDADAPGLSDRALREVETISVGGISGTTGGRAVELDLTDHRWAGLSVLLRVKVSDGAGNAAETLSQRLTLPERPFYNPLAQAVIYERRSLAVAPTSWPTTSRALDALTFAPDRFFDKPKDYLLLRTAYWDVASSRGEYLEETVDRFWPLALQLEDQALELARRALAAAQQALREALERGASPGEIASLVEDLRLAMQNYIQALAESGQAMADDDGPREELGASDLNEMLDSINNLTESGANNAARQMLSQLEQMLSDLKISGGSSSDGATGRAGEQSGAGGGEPSSGSGAGNSAPGSQAMGAAGEMIGRQRELADETFDALREEFGLDGTGGEARPLSELGQDQQSLADDLEQSIRQFGGQDMTDAAQEVIDAFAEALEKMRAATDALEAANPDAASLLQEEALQSLRNGADRMSEEIMKAQEEMAASDPAQGVGEAAAGEAAALDPLGRPYGARPGNAIGIPDLGNPEKARALVQELRRRLAEPGRSAEEIEYLERLLQRF